MKKNLLKLSPLGPGPGPSRSSWTCIPTHNLPAHLILHVAAPNVKCKGFDQAIRKALAPKLLSTHRAARIAPLENIDSQRSVAFQHAQIVTQNSHFVYVNVLMNPRSRQGVIELRIPASSWEIAFRSLNTGKSEFEAQAALAM